MHSNQGLQHRHVGALSLGVVPDIIAYSVLIKGLVDQHQLKKALDILEAFLLQCVHVHIHAYVIHV